jgi:hypothetical protein
LNFKRPFEAKLWRRKKPEPECVILALAVTDRVRDSGRSFRHDFVVISDPSHDARRKDRPRRLTPGAGFCFRPAPLEQVPRKLTDFFDENLLQRFDFERFPIDHMIPCDREAL